MASINNDFSDAINQLTSALMICDRSSVAEGDDWVSCIDAPSDHFYESINACYGAGATNNKAALIQAIKFCGKKLELLIGAVNQKLDCEIQRFSKIM